MTGLFLLIDGIYFASNLTKIPDGGWFPLLIASIVFTPHDVGNGPETAVFLSSTQESVPPALLHNVKHNKVLHERVIVATVVIAKVPHVPLAERLSLSNIDGELHRVRINYGFTDEVDVPAALGVSSTWTPGLKPMDTSYFLGRQTLIASDRPGMAIWRGKLFAWMVRNAESASDFFKLPTNRVVELGSEPTERQRATLRKYYENGRSPLSIINAIHSY